MKSILLWIDPPNLLDSNALIENQKDLFACPQKPGGIFEAKQNFKATLGQNNGYHIVVIVTTWQIVAV